MKKIKFLLFILCITQFSYSQILVGELGYNTGFTGIISVGINDIDYSDTELLSQFNNSFSSKIGYEFIYNRKKYYHGLNLQAAYGILFGDTAFGIKGGFSTSLLFNSGDSKVILRPFIALNLLALNLKFYYNISNVDNFFPLGYNKLGIALSLELPMGK